MKKVHAVSSGTYSDYRVHALFRRKRDAEAAIVELAGTPDFYSGGSLRVEAFHLFDKGEPLVPVPWRMYRVTVWDDGTTSDVVESNEAKWPWEFEAGRRVDVRFVRAPVHQGKGGRLEVYGTDLPAVGQVFSDNRAQVLAAVATTGRAVLEG
ncbi:MAG TPA: hypothetical protein VMW08_05495 [Acidimicrobiales bacterium]|nr:hypothetical protein [Acidimicrobiales bacterium]